ncbi:magnesium transporter MgtE N-terminal domain-containing protein [Clostridium thermarum]|uniref:magnesium transporter MgtE N-terminal domain-containing protein n=1 Tax=Clostridium thermarum TaxID=1716543 RepID=UPI00193F486F|nr:hypothetical protein [Clostridium thermarum]
MENIEVFTDILLSNDKNSLMEFLNSYHPIDVAIILEELEDEQLLMFYELINIEQMAEILEQSNEDFQIRILKLLKYESIIKLFSFMSTDDIADILGNLPFRMRKDLLKMMKSD